MLGDSWRRMLLLAADWRLDAFGVCTHLGVSKSMAEEGWYRQERMVTWMPRGSTPGFTMPWTTSAYLTDGAVTPMGNSSPISLRPADDFRETLGSEMHSRPKVEHAIGGQHGFIRL